MQLPRISIGDLIFGVGILCVPIVLIANYLNGHYLLSKDLKSDLGLWPTIPIFGLASYSLVRNGARSVPFLLGFTVVGWTSVLAYVGVCFWLPDVMQRAIFYFDNDLSFWWYGWQKHWHHYNRYVFGLLETGLYLASPELVMATFGGLVARWIWGNQRRRLDTASGH